jgi:hypothetical protein
VRRPRYPELALALHPARSSRARPVFEIALAAAEATGGRPVVELAPPGAAPLRLPLSLGASGAWQARWAPDPIPAAGRFALRAWLEGAEQATLSLAAGEILPQPVERPPVVRALPPAPAARRLLGRVALAAGMVYNFGELTSPRFSLEAGGDYPLGPGRIGLKVAAGLAWSRHEVPVPRAGEPARLGLLLVPLEVGLGYRLPLGRLAPYLGAGFVAQLVRTSGEGEASGRFVRTDVVPGIRATLGCELALGRGGPFAQLGYEWGKLAVPEVEGLAGGLLVELGYRLRI